MTNRIGPDDPGWDDLIASTLWAYLAAGDDSAKAAEIAAAGLARVSPNPQHSSEYMGTMLANIRGVLLNVLSTHPDAAQWRMMFQLEADLGHLDGDS